ncbi:hypothetical protein L6V77_24570 [Myxococcota bacterium]|nr:hypothetical protein [Myxococcota bacterium]
MTRHSLPTLTALVALTLTIGCDAPSLERCVDVNDGRVCTQGDPAVVARAPECHFDGANTVICTEGEPTEVQVQAVMSEPNILLPAYLDPETTGGGSGCDGGCPASPYATGDTCAAAPDEVDPLFDVLTHCTACITGGPAALGHCFMCYNAVEGAAEWNRRLNALEPMTCQQYQWCAARGIDTEDPWMVPSCPAYVYHAECGNLDRDAIEAGPTLDALLSGVETSPPGRPAGPAVSPPSEGAPPDDAVVFAALEASGWRIHAAARRLGMPRTTLYKLIDRSAALRTAADIPDEEVRAVFADCGGSIADMVPRLRVSDRALRARLKGLGLDPAAEN